MRIEIYVCDNVEALLETRKFLQGLGAKILYEGPSAAGETGDVMRFIVKPPRSPGVKLDSFANKLLVVARRD